MLHCEILNSEHLWSYGRKVYCIEKWRNIVNKVKWILPAKWRRYVFSYVYIFYIYSYVCVVCIYGDNQRVLGVTILFVNSTIKAPLNGVLHATWYNAHTISKLSEYAWNCAINIRNGQGLIFSIFDRLYA